MRMVWTAWTMRGGRTSLSFPTLQVDANKSLSFCYFTVILDLLLKWFPDITPVLALTNSSSARHPRPMQGLHPSPPPAHMRTHIYANTLDFLFLHEIVSQSKVSCCCCYCLTIIATLRGNFTIFKSHEPTMIHLCTNGHLLIF